MMRHLRRGNRPMSVDSDECLLFNCQGLTLDKEQSLYQYLRSRKPLIVVLIETHRSSHRWSAPNDYHVYDIPGMDIGDGLAPRISGGIALVVRNDCTAVSPLSSAALPGFNVNNPFNIPDISSQWYGWKATVSGWHRPLVIIPMYLQHRTRDKHRQEIAPLCNQLNLFAEYIESIDPGDRPWTLICGDFNNHAPELGSHTNDRINVVREFIQRGFSCHNINYCYGTPTHKRDGILDLVFEYPPTDDEPSLVESMSICSKGEIGPLFSDHFPVLLSLRQSTPPPDQMVPRMTWDTEGATAEQIKTIISDIQCALDRPPSEGEWKVVTRLSALLDLRSQAGSHQKAEAASLADAALESIVGMLCDIGARHVKRRPVSEHNRPDWSPGLRVLYRAMAEAHSHSMGSPHDASLATNAQRAREVFSEALTALRRVRLSTMKAMVEEELQLDRDHSKHRIAWKAVKRYSRYTQGRASPIRAGLKRTDGSSTTSVKESQSLLGEYYRKVFSPHPRLQDPHPSSDGDRMAAKRDEGIRDMEEALRYSRLPDGSSIGRPSSIPSSFVLCEDKEVHELLAHTSHTTASGPDDVPGALLAWAAESPAFCNAIKIIFNFCYAFGVLPLLWRSANLLPIPKKTGPLDECNSFRPISITCILMRRMEALVKRKIQPIAERQLSRWQAGFRSRRSTRQQILLLMRSITDALRHSSPEMGAGRPIPVVFLDITKAFDSVPHDHVRLKVWEALKRHHHDVNQVLPLLSFITAFLRQRQFRILAQGVEPGAWMPASAGVPQGAVLSPLLYALFIDELVVDVPPGQSDSKSTTFAFADDLAIMPPINGNTNCRRSKLQKELKRVGEWANCWGVRFSASKSACVWFRPKNKRAREAVSSSSQTELFIPYSTANDDRIKLPYQPHYQYLGVWLDASLSGDRHFTHMVEKSATVSRMLRSLVRPEGVPGLPVLHTLVKALLLPRISYGLPFLNLKQKQYDALNRLVQRPILCAAAIPWNVHRAGASSYFALPTVEVLRDYSIVELITSILRLANVTNIRLAPDRHPAYHLVRRHCNRQAVEGTLQSDDHPPAPHSPIDFFPPAVNRLEGVDLLPDRQHLTTRVAAHQRFEKWESKRFKNQCRRSAQMLQTHRAVMESRGRRFSVGPLSDHNQTVDAAAGPTTKKGVMLPPMMGVPDEIREEKELIPLIKLLPSSLQPKPSLPFSVQYDLPNHLRLRSRCVLNRATGLAAVKHYHNDDPNPSLRQCPYCNNSNVAYRPQTLFHALVECPRYQAVRQDLLDKVRGLIERVRERARMQRYASKIYNNDNNTFVHIVMCTPYVLESINNLSSRLKLLRMTGQFLQTIDLISHL